MAGVIAKAGGGGANCLALLTIRWPQPRRPCPRLAVQLLVPGPGVADLRGEA